VLFELGNMLLEGLRSYLLWLALNSEHIYGYVNMPQHNANLWEVSRMFSANTKENLF
jgi:hypothetical protein